MTFIRGLGYKPDHLDPRDQKFAFTAKHTAASVPQEIDLSSSIDWCYDQGQENSCVAQSTTSLIRFLRKRASMSLFLPSRNFIYWNARALDNPPDTSQDNGTQIRNGLQSVADTGYCSEQLWGYSTPTVFNKPPVACFNAAASNKIATYNVIKQDPTDIRSCLASGIPFVFGITVCPSMMSDSVAQTGIVPLPGATEQPIGGHAILGVGWSASKNKYKFLNSWGTGWGDRGYGYLPPEYVENQFLASDFWTATIAGTVKAPEQVSKPFHWWWPWNGWPWV